MWVWGVTRLHQCNSISAQTLFGHIRQLFGLFGRSERPIPPSRTGHDGIATSAHAVPGFLSLFLTEDGPVEGKVQITESLKASAR